MVSSIRLGGLVSGLDTDTIVKDLMKAEKAPLNKLLQKKQTEEWKRDQYREMNALLLDLKNKTFDMKLQGTYQKKAVSSDNDSIVSAQQKGVPNLSTYNVEVKELPVAAKAASVKFKTNGLVDGSTKIGEVFEFKVGSETIKIESEDTINSVIAKVNAASSKTGVTASYLKDDQSITFTTTKTGVDAEIKLAGSFGTKLGMSSGTIGKNSLTGKSEILTGFNDPAAPINGHQLAADVTAGEVLINNISYAITSPTFTFDGIDFSVKTKGTTKVNVKTDEEAIFNSIKSYVEKYNEIIGKINDKLAETQYKDYKPLLDEEKEALSDKQIEQWEERAKSGLLRRDSLLSGALTELRLALSTNVKGAGMDPKLDSLSEIGISTGTYSEKGKLYINETDLRKAISENGTKVMDLFTKISDSTDTSTKYSESGIAQRLYDQITNSMNKLTEKAGSAVNLVDKSVLGESIKRINRDIDQWEDRLKDIEDRYWRKFTAMEQAMSRANSQSSWLAQQLGGQ